MFLQTWNRFEFQLISLSRKKIWEKQCRFPRWATYSEKFEISAQRSNGVLFFRREDQAGVLRRVVTFLDVIPSIHQPRLLKMVNIIRKSNHKSSYVSWALNDSNFFLKFEKIEIMCQCKAQKQQFDLQERQIISFPFTIKRGMEIFMQKFSLPLHLPLTNAQTDPGCQTEATSFPCEPCYWLGAGDRNYASLTRQKSILYIHRQSSPPFHFIFVWFFKVFLNVSR